MDFKRRKKVKTKIKNVNMEIKNKTMDKSNVLEPKKEGKMGKAKNQYKWIITDSTEEIMWVGDGVDMLDAICNYFKEKNKNKNEDEDFITAWEKLLLGGCNIKRMKLN